MEQLLITNSVIVWLVLLGNLLLTFALVRKVNSMGQGGGNSGPPKEFLKVGQAAPDFTAETLSGTAVTLANYANRKTAFLFMSPGCRPCREAILDLEAVQPKAAQACVTLVLALTTDRERAQVFVDELNVALPVLVTPPTGKFPTDYKVGGTPFYCLVNEHGQVEATGFFDDAWRGLVSQWSNPSRQDGILTPAMLEGTG